MVLAAGSSRRLGAPKQLLPYAGATLLDATLDVARACGFDQLLVTVGAAAADVRTQVDLSGATVVTSETHHEGCASSIRAAVDAIDDACDGIVLLLGDQPGVRPADVTALVAAAEAGAPFGVCRYDDGRGHPLWLGRATFPQLRGLHGDKAVWRLLDDAPDVVEVAVHGTIPLDVDTREDHRRLVAEGGRRRG